MKTRYLLGSIGIVFLMIMGMSPSWADPAQLIVVRSPGGQLYKMTCNGTSCSGWSQVPGIFNQQPTLTWDEEAEQYYLYGVGGDGFTIWRSTFDRAGNHNNDWSPLPGGSPSPVAAAGGEVLYNGGVYRAASNVSQKVFAMSGGCSGNSATETQTFVRTPSGPDTIVTRTDIRRDGSNVECQCSMEKFLSTASGSLFWTQDDRYNATCGVLQESHIYDNAIPRLTPSMAIGKSWGTAATTSPAAGTIVEQVTLLGVEDVTVPAGTYNGCLRVHTSRMRSWRYPGGSGTFVDWMCPNVGRVKRIQTAVDGSINTWLLTSVTTSP